ncbi:MAG TPA: MnhB domain-containing protein [Pirellulales bacterium]|jgi:multicomponent Na+:H+ antiporter subunit B|nr:MnhB domain-containing protein [Pirellulales bacterium]
MTPRIRVCLFGFGALVVGALLLGGVDGLPPFGHYRGPYGDVINAVAVDERHVTNMATAVNFDYRAFDTLGEEYILFAAVTGLALLLRQGRGEIEDEPAEYAADRRVPPHGDALRGIGLLMTAVTVLVGVYVVLHAHLTPGGGFQGGTILGTACLLVYLSVGYREFRAVSPRWLLDGADAAGAGAYALVGIGTLLASGTFLLNVLPLGTTKSLFSGGMIPVINLAVGLEVAGGFILVFTEFLKDTRKPSEAKRP